MAQTLKPADTKHPMPIPEGLKEPPVSPPHAGARAAAPRLHTQHNYITSASTARTSRVGYAHSAFGLLAFFSTAGVGAAGSTGVTSSAGPFCSAASLALPHWVVSRICSWEMPRFVISAR